MHLQTITHLSCVAWRWDVVCLSLLQFKVGYCQIPSISYALLIIDLFALIVLFITMTVSPLGRWPILILALAFIVVTPKFHLQSVQTNMHDSLPIILEDDQSQEGKISIVEDDASAQSRIKIPQNTTIYEENLISGYLVTEKYVLLIKNGPYRTITLWKLDLETIKLEQIPFPFPPRLNQDSLNLITSPKFLYFRNGEIALAYYQRLFILDKQTLEIKQTLVGHDKNDDVRQFYFYEDVKTGLKKIFVSRQRANSLVSQLVRLPSGQYEAKEKIILSWQSFSDTPRLQNSVFLTGLDSGVFLQECSIKYINTLDSIVRISYDPNDYYYQRTKVGVSYDESFFVLFSESGYFEFYNIEEDLEVSLKKSILASKSFRSAKRGATTTDDAFVFATIVNQKGQSDVAKVDPSTGQCTFIAGPQITTKSLLDFNLFEARYNRLVTLELRESNKYFLQLRTVNNLSLISEYPLAFGFPILEGKLVGSPVWDLTFGVALRVNASSLFQQNDTRLYLFEIKGDMIVNRNTDLNVSYDVVQACHKYIVSYKRSRKAIRILSNYDLRLVHQILVDELWQERFSFEKNIFMFRDYSITFVYDFQISFERLGQLFASNFMQQFGFYSIILAKRGLLYQAPTNNEAEIWESQPAAATFFNISYLPFQKQTMIQTPTYLQRCEYADYYPSPKENCNFVFFINCLEEVQGQYCRKPRYVKYKECSNQREEYPIEGYEQKIVRHMHYISSDRKYIIAFIKPSDDSDILLDIRPIDDLNTIFLHQFIGFNTKYYTDPSDVFVDLIKDNLIILRCSDFITAYFILPTEAIK